MAWFYMSLRTVEGAGVRVKVYKYNWHLAGDGLGVLGRGTNTLTKRV